MPKNGITGMHCQSAVSPKIKPMTAPAKGPSITAAIPIGIGNNVMDKPILGKNCCTTAITIVIAMSMAKSTLSRVF